MTVVSEPERREPDAYVPSDREPLPSGLIPAERMALTVARAQLERGDNPPRNITGVLVMTIDRLLGGPGQIIKINEPMPRAFTRDELIEALTRLEVTVATSGPVAGKVLAESMADAIIEALDEGADEAWGGRGPSASYEEWLAEGREDGDDDR